MLRQRPTLTRPKTTRPKPPKSAARQRSDKGKYTPYRMRLSHTLWLVPVVILVGFGSIFCYLASEEMRTSKLQSDYFSRLASQVRFELQDGPNPEMRTPSTGPYNQRLGYSYLPFFIKALEADTYTVARQMRASRRYQALVANGIYPPYRPKPVTGLNLFDRAGQSLYSASYPSHVFADFNDIPPLLVNTLLFIENRELLKLGPVTRNPVIEWDRFFYAALGRVLQNVVPGFNAGGGSTLATQIEKFRFSPGGQTSNAWEKIRQIVSASLRVYMDGPDTTRARERIVLDYLNSTPLSARPGFGEVNSIGDGLWVWFGRDLNEASEALTLPESDPDSLRTKALVYREALGLILAQRRPTAYLMTDRKALDQLTDVMLDRLAANSVISTRLATAAKASSFRFLRDPPQPSNMSFIDQKATTALRTHLMTLLSLKNLYELDRLDLSVASTLDQETQRKVTLFLKKMSDPAFLQAIGLYGFRLLNPNNDPEKIKWSVVLYERGDDVNRLRIQADNIDGPFDMNEGVKLDLGSTAKLRTLVTYLEIVGELYRRYAGLADEDLKDLAGEAPDTLTSWGTTWLSENPDATLENMLEAAMDRPYSASPGETFFTGGGAHRFVNFERSDDGRVMPVRQALRNSVNLVFIRIMRDIVNYTIAQGQQTKEELLSDPDQPARLAYLERYADREGSLFLNRYISDYATLSPDETLVKATTHARAGATSRAILFRSLRPKASFAEFSAYMRAAVEPPPDEAKLAKLFKEYPAERYNLSDRSYITKLNPLELWLASYKQENPKASRNAILAVSQPIRLESYAWLFHPNKKGAQDTRIRILLELDAFARIQQRWARLGYPFEKLVPSFATAIGSSADRPGALAELVGILLNDGVKKPTLRFEKLHFAKDTPYETILVPRAGKAAQVLDPAVARVVRRGMMDVVENGTAKRLRGAYTDRNGQPLEIGGKTGTGDHRFDEYGHGGRLISSRVVNRTGTIVFFIGDRFFGTVTAHVAGEEAGNYKFTSALSAQTLKSLAPILQPIIGAASTPRPSPTEAEPAAENNGKPAPAPRKRKAAPESEPEPNEGNAEEEVETP